eukprot:1185132-Prorocentrum_minimum.AAC.2
MSTACLGLSHKGRSANSTCVTCVTCQTEVEQWTPEGRPESMERALPRSQNSVDYSRWWFVPISGSGTNLGVGGLFLQHDAGGV